MAIDPAPRRSGFWPIVIAVTLIVVLGAWWYMSSGAYDSGEGRDAVPRADLQPGVEGEVVPPPGIVPEPLPGSPAATGTAGEPSGVTGASTQPGSPVQE